MPYNRYTEVDLPHGPVIEMSLWHKVQNKMQEVMEQKSRYEKHCYPLSGILKLDDKSTFVGTGCWSKGKKILYYFNRKNNIRVPVSIFENEALRIVNEIIKKSAPF